MKLYNVSLSEWRRKMLSNIDPDGWLPYLLPLFAICWGLLVWMAYDLSKDNSNGFIGCVKGRLVLRNIKIDGITEKTGQPIIDLSNVDCSKE